MRIELPNNGLLVKLASSYTTPKNIAELDDQIIYFNPSSKVSFIIDLSNPTQCWNVTQDWFKVGIPQKA